MGQWKWQFMSGWKCRRLIYTVWQCNVGTHAIKGSMQNCAQGLGKKKKYFAEINELHVTMWCLLTAFLWPR
jgi:hypothetical protein